MFYILNFIAAMQVRLDDAKDRGATATEYAMLVAFIAIVVVGGVTIFGSALSTWFTGLGNKIGLNK
jgi:pilus assembly protein Flp/PilA